MTVIVAQLAQICECEVELGPCAVCHLQADAYQRAGDGARDGRCDGGGLLGVRDRWLLLLHRRLLDLVAYFHRSGWWAGDLPAPHFCSWTSTAMIDGRMSCLTSVTVEHVCQKISSRENAARSGSVAIELGFQGKCQRAQH